MKYNITTFLLTLFLTTGLFAQTKTAVDLEAVDAYFEQMVKGWDLPSASIGVVKDGKLIFTGNYGVKEIGKNQKPDKSTLYAIASNSKAFTSTMIGMLVEEGKLNWDDKVQQHLPYFELYDDYVSSHATIRDILSHRVGLGTFSGDNIWYKSNISTEEVIKRAKHVEQKFEFRNGFGYSNLMYITAGEIIETVTGKSWAQNVEERILKPLGMDRTIVSINDLESKGNFATPHARKDDKNYSIPWTNWDNVAATGGLISSVEDVAKWMIFNMKHGIHGQDTLFSKSTRNMIWTPHNNFAVDHTSKNEFNRHFNSYGLGWGLSDFHGRMRVGHTGGYDGMITAVTMIPDENLGVVVLTNGVKSPITAATFYALHQFLGIESDTDWSKESLARSNRRAENDTRITDRKNQRVLNTNPMTTVADFTGDYHSALNGVINIAEVNGELKLTFNEAEQLSATLTHWHYDVWQIHWDHPQAWFGFGTVKIETNNQMEVIGLSFDVPNDDFFFEEIKAKR